jgi:sigma54-dependent transcription regulator
MSPYIKINCAALSEQLIESELFGHEKGAFTGATDRREGRFELANKGTLLLDEVSEIPPNLQAKLLRVLQEREFERVGGTKTIKVNVRILATSNRDLIQFVERGSFRSDLYYRLNVFPVHVAALRERPEDITLLADSFLRRFSRKHGLKIPGFTDNAIAALVGLSLARKRARTAEHAGTSGDPLGKRPPSVDCRTRLAVTTEVGEFGRGAHSDGFDRRDRHPGGPGGGCPPLPRRCRAHRWKWLGLHA